MPNRDVEELSRDELVTELRELRSEHLSLIIELEHRQSIWSHYARLYDGAPVAFLMLDKKGTIHSANRAAATLLGYDQAGMIGKPFIVAARMRDAAPFWKHLARCLGDRATVSTEIELDRDPGVTRAAHVISTPLLDPLHGFLVATVLVDLEERVQIEREVQRAHLEEQRIRARMEAQVRAGAAIGEAHAEMHVHGVESVLEAIAEQARHLVDGEMCALGIGGAPDQPFDHWSESGMGIEASRAIGRPPNRVGVLERVASGSIVRTADVTHHPSFHGLPAGHLPIGSFLGVPIRHRDRPVGSLYVANKRTAAQFDEDDERALVLLAEYAAFVIEAALATDAEVRERTRLRSIIDQLPEAVIIKDTQGRLIPNAKSLELTIDSGGRVDASGNPIQWDVRYPDGSPVPWEDLPLMRAFRDRVAVANVEMLAATRDGRLIPVLVDATPLVDETGESLGAVVVWRNVEQVKRLEELRQEWAAVVAHDLRQPLHVIKMWDQMLASTKDARDKRDVRAVAAIEKAVGRMGDMIDDLVDTSLLEMHKLELHKEPLHLDELLREAVSSLSEDHRLRLDIEPGLPDLDLDRRRLERVLDNLISNAFKYGTPETEVVVAATRHEHEVEVAVTNFGEPLSADEVRQLFSRFYRTTSAQRHHGLGLGLYIAQGFVEAHGGRLRCESADGRTTFRFTLPCPDVAAHAQQQHQPTA